MQKVVVTGAAGFIGSHLVDLLLAKGFQVVGLDNFKSGKVDNLAHALKNSQFSFYEGDICDVALLEKIMPQTFAVYHQAAIVSVPLCTESPDLAVSVNIDGFSKVLMSAVKNKVERFFYASSCAVYGDQGETPIAEEAPLCPMSLYAVTKETNEKIAFCVAKEFGIITHGLRYFNVYGNRQDPTGPYAGVIAKFMDLVKAQKKPIIWGSGSQTRDFVHVSDLVQVLASMLNLPKNLAKDYKALNVASGASRSVLELWKIILSAKKIQGTPDWAQPEFKSHRANDILHSKANLDKLTQMFQKLSLDYQPMALEQGICHLLWLAERE